MANVIQLSDGGVHTIFDDRDALDLIGEYMGWDMRKWLEDRLSRGGRDLVFVVGGAYGFGTQVYERADALISLSEMTFSHQIVRTIFAEQLYRAFTIIRGEPYHHQ